MQDRHERLAWAREDAGYETPTDAADALGVPRPTYLGHENGNRGFKQQSAEKYARRFAVDLAWLLTGKGTPKVRLATSPNKREVRLVGYVSAGAEAHFLSAGDLGGVDAPEGATDNTVAVEIRGDSLGPLFDRWLVFYDDVRRPITSDTDLIGKLCVVGLVDGRVLIKKIKKSRARGLFHLISQAEDPILDVEIEWAAAVRTMVPR